MKTTFVLAEEFRQEANNKVSAIGLYSAQVVLLNRLSGEENATNEQRLATLPIALDRLGFLFTTTGVEGKHEVYLQVITPSGKVLMQSNKSEINILENSGKYGHTFVIQANPFVIPEIGEYICRYWFDETYNDFPLIIEFNTA